MDLKLKLSILRQFLTNQGDFSIEKIEQYTQLKNEIERLAVDIQQLKEENKNLNLNNDKLKHLNENLSVLCGKKKSNGKLFKPDKIVIAKYSLFINRERTHVGAFTKKDIYYGCYRKYDETVELGHVLKGLFDDNLCGLLNVYGEANTDPNLTFTDVIGQKAYTSNIIIYDYLTLPQLLNLMDVSLSVVDSKVTSNTINSAVKYAESHIDELFNKRIPKKKKINRR